jgi:hypothetical protein
VLQDGRKETRHIDFDVDVAHSTNPKVLCGDVEIEKMWWELPMQSLAPPDFERGKAFSHSSLERVCHLWRPFHQQAGVRSHGLTVPAYKVPVA